MWSNLCVQLQTMMAPVYMKLFLVLAFLVGAGLCQDNATTTTAAAAATTAATPAAATSATTTFHQTVSHVFFMYWKCKNLEYFFLVAHFWRSGRDHSWFDHSILE